MTQIEVIVNGSRAIFPTETCPPDDCPQDDYPQTIASEETPPQDNNPQGKFPAKIIAPTRVNKITRAWYLREARGNYTYLPQKTGIFPLNIVRN